MLLHVGVLCAARWGTGSSLPSYHDLSGTNVERMLGLSRRELRLAGLHQLPVLGGGGFADGACSLG